MGIFIFSNLQVTQFTIHVYNEAADPHFLLGYLTHSLVGIKFVPADMPLPTNPLGGKK